MYCRYCGENLPDDSQFCHKCGKQLVETLAEPVAEQQPAQSTGDGCEITGPLPNISELLESSDGQEEPEAMGQTELVGQAEQPEQAEQPAPEPRTFDVEEYEKTTMLVDPAEVPEQPELSEQPDQPAPEPRTFDVEEYEKTTMLVDPADSPEQPAGPNDEMTWLLPEDESAGEASSASASEGEASDQSRAKTIWMSGWMLPLFVGGVVALVGALFVIVFAAMGMFDERESQSSAQPAELSGESALEDIAEEVEAIDAPDGVPFSAAQLYEGALYIGAVRTQQGLEAVTTIAGTRQPPVQAEQFMFADGFYYYVEDLTGSGLGASKLHSYDLAKKSDEVIADDVAAYSRVYFVDGFIVYRSTEKVGACIKAFDVQKGESETLDFETASGAFTLCGVADGKAVVATSRIDQRNRVFECPITDGAAKEVLAFGSNESLSTVCDGMLISVNQNTVVGYDVDGDQVWTTQLPVESVNANSVYVEDGVLFYTGSVADSPASIITVDAQTGESHNYPTPVSSTLVVLYTDGKMLYFCDVAVLSPDEEGEGVASDGESVEGAEEEDAVRGFATYGLRLADGTVTRLDVQR